MSECLNGDLRVRVNQLELNTFIEDAPLRTGKKYQLLIRECITAFNDGRLRIIPTEAQKTSIKSIGELYNVD